MDNGHSELVNGQLLKEHSEELSDSIDAGVEQILRKYSYGRNDLISILLDVQEEFNYLPKEGLTIIAKRLGIRLSEVYGVASFYKIFSLSPRGKHVISVCTGTACHVRGAGRVVDKLRKELDIDVGQTTFDGLFTLETVRCLGACALGPAVVVSGEYYGQVNAAKVDSILQKYNGNGTRDET